MAEKIELLSFVRSPYGCRVEIGLKLKGIQYEFIHQNIADKSPELLKYNPIHKLVPVLVHNGKPVCESVVILEYIDETWEGSASLLPKDPYQRAMARFWTKFIDDKALPVLKRAFTTQGEDQKKAVEESKEVLARLENELEYKKFFGGDNIGLVDIAAVFIAFWLVILQEVTEVTLVTKETFPKLSKWIDDFNSCEAVKKSLPPREGTVAYFRGLFGKA